MSGRAVQVKAILLKDGVQDGLKEIRRFRVDEDGNEMGGRQRLQNLLTRVHSVFNIDPTNRRCDLYWKDEDDDLIRFSSEEELCHGVDNMSDDTLRIYVIVTSHETGRMSEEPKEPQPDKSRGPTVETAFTFQTPPPPPPPPYHHPAGLPPPPFVGPWAHGGWKNWKPMGPGGWKGGLRFGCPVGMGCGMHGCGWKGKGGLFKQGWGKQIRKMMKMKYKMDPSQQEEFKTVQQQVPLEFRGWVRRYVHAWYFKSPEAALAKPTDKLPECVGQGFPQWLNTFLWQHYPHLTIDPHTSGEGEGETDMEVEMGDPPACLPPVYFRWLCFFMPRFLWRNRHVNYTDRQEGEGPWCQAGHRHAYGMAFDPRGFFGWPGNNGCQKKKGGKRRCSSSSESEDSNCGDKGLCKVPKGFCKFVRMSMKQLHKGKGDKCKIKENATHAGLSFEVQEFVEQVMLEWHAKLSRQQRHVVTKEMMEAERTLPSGLQQEHFQWLCRFVARWHRRNGGAMSGWSIGETTTDGSSGDEATPSAQGCGSCLPFYPDPHHFWPGMGGMCGHPHTGMMGGHHFAMPPGMGHPFPPPPPPPPMYGCFPPPPPPPGFHCPGFVIESGGEVSSNQSMGCGEKPQDCRGCKDQEKDTEAGTSKDDSVDHVTEGVRRL